VIIKAFKSVNSLVSISIPKAYYSENSSLLCPFPAKPRQIPSRLAVSPIEPVGLNLTCHVTSPEMTVAAVISDNYQLQNNADDPTRKLTSIVALLNRSSSILINMASLCVLRTNDPCTDDPCFVFWVKVRLVNRATAPRPGNG
jgi:hypothetical protein